MLRILAACVLLFPAVLAAQSDTSPEARAQVVRERTAEAMGWLVKAEPEQKKRLAAYKRAVIRPNAPGIVDGNPIQVPSKEVKAKEIARAEKQLAETQASIEAYKAGEKFSFGTLPMPPKLGAFGMFGSGGVHVFQVLGKDSMLVDTDYQVGTTGARDKPVYADVTMMVRKVPTKGIVDDSGWDTTQVFEVVDTKTYRTADGSNTVFVIEPLNTAPIEAELRKASAPK